MEGTIKKNVCEEGSCCASCAQKAIAGPKDKLDKLTILRLGTGALLFLLMFAVKLPFYFELFIYVTTYLIVGGDVVLRAVRNITKGRVFDENFLMTIATVGAFALQEFQEGVAVMLFYQIGELFQELALNRSRRSISKLMDIRPDYANLWIDGVAAKVSPDEVKVGDLILVKPGEKIPLDGKVVEGISMLDTSALTGEALPKDVEAGDEVLSGSININGLLKIQVTKMFGESTVTKILDMVQNAGSRKAPTENFITKFARYYTPAVVIAAVILAVVPPLVITGAAFPVWINRALTFLVVSCPCALVISIPLSFFGGIGGASRNSILIKGGNYLEALNNVDTFVFDKTGTLTKGVFKVTGAVASGPFSNEELLEYAAYAERYSSHPIAISILKAYGKALDIEGDGNYEELSGQGVKTLVNGRQVLAGNSALMDTENIQCAGLEAAGTIVHVAVDGNYAGYLIISDEVREDSQGALKALKEMGIRKLAMLTGDNKVVGEKIAAALGIDEVHAGLLPAQKVERLELISEWKTSKGKVAFVGDGINDAPVLARADIGIAMGALGSDAAIEAADIVLMTDEPSKLVTAVKIARRTRSIVMQNIIFALGVKALVLVLSAGGLANMWEAVFADVGVALIAVINAMRVMKTEI